MERYDQGRRAVRTRGIFLVAVFAAALLAGCGGGGVDLDASSNTVVNDNSNNSGGGSSNPCANYLDPDTSTRIQGTFDGANCVYGPEFVGETNPLMTDLTIPFISGVHVFEDTLQVGRYVDGTNPAETVPQDGEGPTLTIRPGNRVTFLFEDDYLLVNRGSRIIAEGTRSAPIVLSGYKDLILGTADPEEVQLWGGLVINGNGVTNKCSDAQRTQGTCHVKSEGKDSFYGGNNNAESSGSLKFVVIKHPGFEVAPGDELNGITFNAVGSGTVVQNVQVYSTYDDGVEFFGGAVQVSNLVALYVNDDSIDWADGWVGSVDKALIIQSATNGDRCIEADNQETQFDALPLSSPTIRNMTCIPGGAKLPVATHGDSMGSEFRRGTQFAVQDSIWFTGHAQAVLGQVPGRCVRVSDTQTAQRAQSGASSVKSSLLACQTPTSNGTNWSTVFANGDSVTSWLLNNGVGAYPENTNNVDLTVPDAAAAGAVQVLDGFYTVDQFADAAGTPFDIISVNGGIIGAVAADDDWTAGWTFGLDDLWF
jgi:hypothetical protein